MEEVYKALSLLAVLLSQATATLLHVVAVAS